MVVTVLAVETLPVEFAWYCLSPIWRWVSLLKILCSLHPMGCCSEFTLSRLFSTIFQTFYLISFNTDCCCLSCETCMNWNDTWNCSLGITQYPGFFFFKFSISIKILVCICSQLYGSIPKDSSCVFKSSSAYIRHRISAYEPTPSSQVESIRRWLMLLACTI